MILANVAAVGVRIYTVVEEGADYKIHSQEHYAHNVIREEIMHSCVLNLVNGAPFVVESFFDVEFEAWDRTDRQNEHFNNEPFAPAFLQENEIAIIVDSFGHTFAIIIYNDAGFSLLAAHKYSKPFVFVVLAENDTYSACD